MTSFQLNHLSRYKDIGWLLKKYGHSDLAEKLGTDFSFTELLNEDTSASPQELVKDLKKLGPTFVRLGQLLSTQTDLLPDAYVEAIAHGQDHGELMTKEMINQIFLEELGTKTEDVFKTFDWTPLTTTLLSQVHRAVLPSQRVVAVKIQRPYVKEEILRDLDVLKLTVQWLEEHKKWARSNQLIRKIEQLHHSLLDELNYEKEAAHQILLKKQLEPFKHLVIPTPIRDYTTPRILTLDLLTGQKITHLSPLTTMEINGKELVAELYTAYLQQLLIDGVFHINLRPGNVYLAQDQRLVLMDLSLIARLPSHFRHHMLLLIAATEEFQEEGVIHQLIYLGQKNQTFNETQLRYQINQLFNHFYETSSSISLGKLLIQMEKIAGDNGLVLPLFFSLVGRTFINVEQVGKQLVSYFHANHLIRKFANEQLEQKLSQESSSQSLAYTRIETRELFQQLPAKLTDLLNILSKNDFKVHVHCDEEERQNKERQINRLIGGIILAALILSASLLMFLSTPHQFLGMPVPAFILWFLSGLGIFLFVNQLIGTRRKY